MKRDRFVVIVLSFLLIFFTQSIVYSEDIQQKSAEGMKDVDVSIQDVKKDVKVESKENDTKTEQKEGQKESQEQKEVEKPKEPEKPKELEKPKEAEKPTPLPPTVVQPTLAPQQKKQETISFFFDDADIFEVAQTIFADVLKANYIIDPQVKGRVNFRTINPIPKDEVLSVMEIILRLNGIGFVEEGGIYRIVPLQNVSKELIYSQIGKPPEKVAIEMFTFKNLDLKESMQDIESALGLHLKEGFVRIVPIYRLNSIIVVASTKEQLDYIRKWVEVFDNMFSVARPKIFVYPLQNSKATHIASLLQSIFSGTATPTTQPTTTRTETPRPAGAQQPQAVQQPVRTGPAATVTGGGAFVSAETRIFADEITNSLIILATPADYSFIEETIKKLDVLPRQVMIEALVAEITLTDDLSFGLAWSLSSSLKLENLHIDLKEQMGQSASLLGTQGSATLSGSGFTYLATDPTGIVRARLEALAQESKARVLASPHVLVLDNREARIQIGDQVPIATSETNITGTTQIQRTIQYKDTGVILKVKPQVNEGGLVSLELTQEVSTYSIKKIFDSDQIVISKREATTNLVAQHGQTIVIGGLISEQTSKAREGIPLLTKIPLLGYLFGSTTNRYERKELVILLTPYVVKNQQEAGSMSDEYMGRLKGVKKEVIEKEILIKEKSKKEEEK